MDEVFCFMKKRVGLLDF